ncbi:hypothetical protein BCR43DRAFT_483212 [Syncephalastrum racemosum]|uniref:Uncharacterized protein n=1 Tax=Syncephalastrum racemosum TaxID=13706 RepID=A0A1X2HV53_SYNRA|nr:hypothetical protein BCR43DRAFT_483212 [Syncephalastrum racemosum]
MPDSGRGTRSTSNGSGSRNNTSNTSSRSTSSNSSSSSSSNSNTRRRPVSIENRGSPPFFPSPPPLERSERHRTLPKHSHIAASLSHERFTRRLEAAAASPRTSTQGNDSLSIERIHHFDTIFDNNEPTLFPFSLSDSSDDYDDQDDDDSGSLVRRPSTPSARSPPTAVQRQFSRRSRSSGSSSTGSAPIQQHQRSSFASADNSPRATRSLEARTPSSQTSDTVSICSSSTRTPTGSVKSFDHHHHPIEPETQNTWADKSRLRPRTVKHRYYCHTHTQPRSRHESSPQQPQKSYQAAKTTSSGAAPASQKKPDTPPKSPQTRSRSGKKASVRRKKQQR